MLLRDIDVIMRALGWKSHSVPRNWWVCQGRLNDDARVHLSHFSLP